MSRTTSPYRMVCKHCGRQWDTKGNSRSALPARQGKSNATGFIVAAAAQHENICSQRTPVERAAANAKDEARWLRSPPRNRIWNDPGHVGLSG